MTIIRPPFTTGLELPRLPMARPLIELKLDQVELPDGLQIGTRIEITPIRQPDSALVRLRIDLLDVTAAGTTIDQQHSAASLPRRLVALAVTADGVTSAPSSVRPRLQAEVVALEPKLVLRLITDHPAITDRPAVDRTPLSQPATVTSDWLTNQIRRHLPRALPLAATLATWRQPTPDKIALSATVPTPELPQSPPLRSRLIDGILDQLASTADLTEPSRVRQAVRHSGLWCEASLGQQALRGQQALDPTWHITPESDLKAQLARLAEQVRTLQRLEAAPASRHELATDQAARQHAGSVQTADADQTTRALTTLDRQVNGMLEKIVTNQLVTLQADPDQPRWLLELPFRTPSGIAELEADIRRERRSPDKEDETWHMRLRLNLPRLGPVTIRLSLHADRLSAGLHAASVASSERLSRNLPLLRARLTAKSIEVASLHAGQRPDTGQAPPTGSVTLNERA